MKTVAWHRRERKVRYAIVRDLIRLDLLECKRISVQRHTRLLPESRIHRQAAANAETITMKTDVV